MRIPLDHPDRHVCIVGMGYVGLTLAVAMADMGFRVHGVERSGHIRDRIKAGRAHFRETGLDERLASRVSEGCLTVSDTVADAKSSNVYIITVGTPLIAGEKSTNLSAISEVAQSVASVLTPGNLVILRSTVRVGVSRDIVRPILDKAGVPYDLAFCPERTLEGKALAELKTLPQVVGGLTESSCLRATQLFNFLTPTTVKVRDLETAEMIKLINNTQRDLLFAFANEVAHFCDAVGVSAPEVLRAGNMGYPRGLMPMPGPVGGPCLEKDPYILAEGLAMHGGSAPIALNGRRTNEDLPRVVVDKLASEIAAIQNNQHCKIAVIGLAFKGRPETSDLRGSLAIPLIAELRRVAPNADIVGYDPMVASAEIATLGVTAASSIEDAFDGSSLAIFQTNHPSFERLPLSQLALRMAKDSVIYDLWNQIDPDEVGLSRATRYAGLGSWLLLNRTLVSASVVSK
jgi:UDP-N-acetyl-D-mannosaminuronic acid dehydrogenase